MNAVAKLTTTTTELDLKSAWMAGDCDLFSRYMEKDTDRFFKRLGLAPRTRLLDVGCGSGQLARIAARAGVQVTACDIAPNWLENGRALAAAEGLAVTFDEAGAESLPYGDAQFDAVVSVFGAMFAPRPDQVAAELIRVCRPGGMIAMANWTPGGFVAQILNLIPDYIQLPGMPSPLLWGHKATVRGRLRKGLAVLQLTPRIHYFDYPFPPEEVAAFFLATFGPMARAFESLSVNAQEKLRTELIRLWSFHNEARGRGTKVDAEYLEVIAITNAP